MFTVHVSLLLPVRLCFFPPMMHLLQSISIKKAKQKRKEGEGRQTLQAGPLLLNFLV